MNVLNLIENHGYEGIFTTPIAVSESKENLENLIETVKKEAVEMKKMWENKEKELERKYLQLRENKNIRTKEEVEDRTMEWTNIQKLFKYTNNMEIHYNIILAGNTSFEIKKIELI